MNADETEHPTVRDRAAAMSLGWNMIDLEAIKGRSEKASRYVEFRRALDAQLHNITGALQLDDVNVTLKDQAALIAEVERQQAEIERLREALQKARGWLEGWASAEHELAVINAALTPPEIKP